MAVRKFLDISTAHIRPSSIIYFRNNENTLYSDYGIMIHVPDVADMDSNYPTDLQEIMTFARNKECAYILIDRDACIIEELPTYLESWE